MRYFITGGSGQLGYDIKRVLEEEKEKEIFAFSHQELDITNKDQVVKKIKEIKPDVIFHCAAYTKVDQASQEKELCFQVNVEGTKNIVDGAKAVGAKIFYVSTDYVFDGEKEGSYDVSDPPCPINTYGMSKYLGEEEVKKYEKHFIVRISWVFGKNGSNFVKTMLRLSENHKELNVVCDQKGSPTYTYDVARLLLEMSKTEKYGIYHATNEGICSWYQFAKEILKDKDICIHPTTSSEYAKIMGTSMAARPKNSSLDKRKLKENGFSTLPSWQDALKRYKEEMK